MQSESDRGESLAYRCPSCHAPLRGVDTAAAFSCGACGFEIPVFEHIPLLVRERATIERTIATACDSGRSSWYQDTQLPQWEGPYRHHLMKRRAYVEHVLEAARRERPGPWTGLDLGCGDGANLAWLSRHFQTFYASDYNLRRLLRASRLRQAQHLFMADVTDYPVLDDSFDAIFFNHVLEHIPEDETALAEVHRILKPGGLAMLGVPNEGALFWQLAYRLQPATRRTTDHVHFYTADTISEKCRRVGLEVRSVQHIGWGLPHWSLDAMVRRYKWADDLLESVGARFFPSQASSLYLCLSK